MLIRAALRACLCVCALVVAAVTASPSCNESDVEASFHFHAESHDWAFDTPNACGFVNHDVYGMRRALAGKTVLFVGDSTVRNVGRTMAAMLCNPKHFSACSQHAGWPWQHENLHHAMTCRNTTSDNECGRMLQYRTIALPNLTADKHYTTKQERKDYWRRGIIPPMVVAKIGAFTLVELEAGCFRHSDGLWKVFDYLVANAATLPKFDAVVTSGGLHCSYQQYRSGQWYLSLGRRWHNVTSALAPVLWLEITHCLKDRTGHYYMMGRQRKLNYRKLVACDYVAKHIEGIRTVFKREAKLFVSPTRFITKGPRLMGDHYGGLVGNETDHSCVFSDQMHPALKCYGAMVQVHVNMLTKHVFPAAHPGRAQADGGVAVLGGGEAFVGVGVDALGLMVPVVAAACIAVAIALKFVVRRR